MAPFIKSTLKAPDLGQRLSFLLYQQQLRARGAEAAPRPRHARVAGSSPAPSLLPGPVAARKAGGRRRGVSREAVTGAGISAQEVPLGRNAPCHALGATALPVEARVLAGSAISRGFARSQTKAGSSSLVSSPFLWQGQRRALGTAGKAPGSFSVLRGPRKAVAVPVHTPRYTQLPRPRCTRCSGSQASITSSVVSSPSTHSARSYAAPARAGKPGWCGTARAPPGHPDSLPGPSLRPHAGFSPPWGRERSLDTRCRRPVTSPGSRRG